MEMIRDTLLGDMNEKRAKLEALCKNEDAAMEKVEQRANERMDSPEFSNRHRRRAHESIQRKIERLKRELKDA